MRLSSVVASLIVTAASSMAASSPAAPQMASSDPAGPAHIQALFDESVQNARHGRYIAASFGLLRQLGVSSATDIKDPDLFDQWAQVMSCMTNSPRFNTAKSADFRVPAREIVDLRAADAIPAMAEIVRRARQTRVVILDENHLDPRQRAFALEVARALRPLGYTVLAAEALKSDADDAVSRARMARIVSEGYVRQSDGYYFDDPVFADFIRQSLALGYRPVAYETTRAAYASDPSVAQAQREQDQADNIIKRALHADPDAKILIYVGEHHAAEHPITAEGGKIVWMAQRLKQASGIDPLTIDQAGLSPVPMNRPDSDLYAIAVRKAQGRSVVLMRHGKPLTVGLLAGSVDLQVVHPQAKMVDGRPDWLEGMGRTATVIPPSLMPESGTRLIQAFIASEAEDARPIDQVLVTAGKPRPELMLPNRPIRYATQDIAQP